MGKVAAQPAPVVMITAAQIASFNMLVEAREHAKTQLTSLESQLKAVEADLLERVQTPGVKTEPGVVVAVHVDKRRNVKWREEFEKVKSKEAAEHILSSTPATEYPHLLTGPDAAAKLVATAQDSAAESAYLGLAITLGTNFATITEYVKAHAKDQGWRDSETAAHLADVQRKYNLIETNNAIAVAARGRPQSQAASLKGAKPGTGKTRPPKKR